MSQNMTGSTKGVLVLVAIIAIVIPIALGAVLIHGPIPLPTSTAAPPSSTSSGSGPASPTVNLPSGVGANQQLNFSPATLSVTSGTTITFVNQDTATHNIDFTSVPSGSTVAQGTTSPNLKNGNMYTVTLTTPGTYTYVCDYHNWMKGTITVTG
jgi:plastocyanin